MTEYAFAQADGPGAPPPEDGLNTYDLVWRQTVALERAATAQETIAAKQTVIAAKQTVIAEKQTLIEQHQATIVEHLAAIREYERCMCECCTNGAMRSELLIETTMENADKPPAERHAIYEQELTEAGAT